MTDFAEGDKVVLIDSEDCKDDWSDVRGVISRISTIANDEMIRITPTVDRPDGHGRASFIWEKNLLIKDEFSE